MPIIVKNIQTQLKIYFTNKKVLMGCGFMVLVVFAVLIFSRQSTTIPQTPFVPVNKIDAINSEPVTVTMGSSIEKREVYQMPQFILNLPDADWFSDYKMRLIAGALGFTNKSAVMNFGQQAIWQDQSGIVQVMINPQMGDINFSTAFNLADISLPDAMPTQDMALAALDKFFAITQLPTDFYNFEKATYQYFYLENGIPSYSLSGTGSLLRMDIPYEVVTVPVFLPEESYIVVDGKGVIRLMNLLVPNIVQTDQTLTLISWGKAKSMVKNGQGAVIQYGSTTTNTFSIDESYPAYYLNQSLYYQIGKQRILNGVYVFEGNGNRVIVEAEQ